MADKKKWNDIKKRGTGQKYWKAIGKEGKVGKLGKIRNEKGGKACKK